MEKPQSARNPKHMPHDMNRRTFLGAAFAFGTATVLPSCSGSDSDDVHTTTGSKTGTGTTGGGTSGGGTSGGGTSGGGTSGGGGTTNSGTKSGGCQEKCPICGQVCWLQQDVQPHECPSGHYWKLRNGVWYVKDWDSGNYYDAGGHPY